MKSCPTCERTFEDTFTFCLVDGGILSAPYNPQATQRIPATNRTDLPTEVVPGSHSQKPPRERELKKPSRLKRAIRVMMICGFIGILPGILIAVIVELALYNWKWPSHVDEQFGAVGSGALLGFIGGAILFPLLWKFMKYVWKD